jgi:hypothetical protein
MPDGFTIATIFVSAEGARWWVPHNFGSDEQISRRQPLATPPSPPRASAHSRALRGGSILLFVFLLLFGREIEAKLYLIIVRRLPPMNFAMTGLAQSYEIAG